MDYGMMPPEVNSNRMYFGPGPGSMYAAMAAWEGLSAEFAFNGVSFASAIAGLEGTWLGPSSAAMLDAAIPYIAWMATTAAQAMEVSMQHGLAINAFETAYAGVIDPQLIAANRVELAALVASNVFGQNTPAIMANEAQYAEFWAQDAGEMYQMAGEFAAATGAMLPLLPAAPTVDPAGPAMEAASAADAGGIGQGSSSSTVGDAMSAVSGMGGSLGSLGGIAQSGQGLLGGIPGILSSLATGGPMAGGGLHEANPEMYGSGVGVGPIGAALRMPGGLGAIPGIGGGGVYSPPSASAVMGRAVSVGGLSVPERYEQMKSTWVEPGRVTALEETPVGAVGPGGMAGAPAGLLAGAGQSSGQPVRAVSQPERRYMRDMTRGWSYI